MDITGDLSTIYLDYSATAPLRAETILAVTAAMAAVGNASSLHGPGRAAAEAVEQARNEVAGLLGCGPSELVFTSGATEANNRAISGGPSGYGPIVISAVEHPAVEEVAAAAAGRRGTALHVVPVHSDGMLDLDVLSAFLDAGPSLVSIMAANNETGVLFDLPAVVKMAHNAGALVHTDATQLVGKVPIDLRELDVDLLSLSAHKFGGPQGVGALFVRRGLQIRPLTFGGSHERGRRPGTLNVAGIVGLGAAAAAVRRRLAHEAEHASGLRDRLEAGVLARVPQVRRNGRLDRRLPGVSSMTFPGAPADAVLAAMPLVAASEGSACAAGALEPSRVLTAMGLSREEADCTLRFSLGYATTGAEVDRAVAHIADAVRQIRAAMGSAAQPAGEYHTETVERISE